MENNVLTVTGAAAARIRDLVTKSEKPVSGLRLTVNEQGCSGMSYSIGYAEEIQPGDMVIEKDGATVYIDPEAIPYVEGSEMDFTQDKFTTGFTFSNPNETGRCGCGESFRI